jgi:hypothetical protein
MVTLSQSSTTPEDEVTYSLTIDPSYNKLFGNIAPWVKLSLPDCVTFKE